MTLQMTKRFGLIMRKGSLFTQSHCYGIVGDETNKTRLLYSLIALKNLDLNVAVCLLTLLVILV